MIRIGPGTGGGMSNPDRAPMRQVLGLPESSGSPRGSTFYKRANTCPRADRLYQLGVRRSGPKSEALDLGDAFHLVLERFYECLMNGTARRDAIAKAWQIISPLHADSDYWQMLAQLEKCLTSYFEYSEHDRWRVLAVEENLGYRDERFEYTARLDGIIIDEQDGCVWGVEHKTARTITADLTQGYLLDIQVLGQLWLMRECVDFEELARQLGLPSLRLAGVIVNITSKQATPKHERVYVRASEAHLAEFELSVWQRTLMQAYAAQLGYPKMLGNCTGAPQYFKSCDFFDICHGHPTFDLLGVDKLSLADVPYGFTVVAGNDNRDAADSIEESLTEP